MRSIIDKALQAILKMLKKKDERVTLWENASPTSEFKAQTLSIDLNDYDFVKITTMQNLSSTNLTTMHDIPVGKASHMGMVGSANSQGQLTLSRDATVSKSGISFDSAYYKTTASTAQGKLVNDSLIPLVVYGLKSGGGKLASAIRRHLKGGVCYGC